jgi:hypothetical protein
MSFQAYIDNIQKKTGKTPADFKELATKKGFLKDGNLVVKATEITNWLKEELNWVMDMRWQFMPHSKGKPNKQKPFANTDPQRVPCY